MTITKRKSEKIRKLFQCHFYNLFIKYMDPVLIFTTSYSSPEFIQYQYECIKKFITVPFTYYVFDNAPNDQLAARNKEIAGYVGANYLRMPRPNSSDASAGAGYSIDFSLKHIYNTLNFKGLIMCLDCDMFPLDFFNPYKILEDNDFVGISQAMDNRIFFFTNQLFIMNSAKITNIDGFSFLPGEVEGVRCDCGGHLYTYFKNHPELKTAGLNQLRAPSLEYIETIPSIFREYFIENIKIIPPIFSEIYADVFLHLRAGSNWIGHSQDIYYKRCDLLYTFICNRLIDWNIKNDPENKYIIATSLYGGSNPKYTYNAIINALIAKKVYKGWIIRYYVDDTVPENIINVLKSFDNAEVVHMTSLRSPAGGERCLWRFHPASEPNVAAMISRDLDTWVSFRDAALTKKWIDSDKGLHIIRDHCYHSHKIMAGMWGIKRDIFPKMKELCDEFSLSNSWDQGFLADIVYPACINNSLVHANEAQRKMGGAVAHGYFPDGGIPFSDFPKIRTYIPGLDMEDVNSKNLFKCAHCGAHHNFFIGNMINHITPELESVVKKYLH